MKYAFPIFRYYRGTIYLLTNAARRVMRIMQKGKRKRKKPRYKAGRARFLRRVRRFSVRRMRRELWRLGEPPASPDRDCATPRRALSPTALTAGLPELFSLSVEEGRGKERSRGHAILLATITNRRYQSGRHSRHPRCQKTREDSVTMARSGPAEAPLPSPPLPLVPLGARISRERFHFGSKPLLGDTARAPARGLQRYSGGGGRGGPGGTFGTRSERAAEAFPRRSRRAHSARDRRPGCLSDLTRRGLPSKEEKLVCPPGEE